MNDTRLAMVHSAEKEGPQEVTVISYKNVNDVIVVTKDGVTCHAIDNVFNGLLYADDIYGAIGPNKKAGR